MIVVADTSPLNYLVQLELHDLLHQLYGVVLIPEDVSLELSAIGAPRRVREWAQSLPPWIEVRRPSLSPDAELSGIDAGERAAIQLAQETSATLLLLDDLAARTIAQRQFGMKVTGTLGILRDAHLAGLVDARVAYGSLCERTNFYRNAAVEQLFLESLTPK